VFWVVPLVLLLSFLDGVVVTVVGVVVVGGANTPG
jgi:hypothetical protein